MHSILPVLSNTINRKSEADSTKSWSVIGWNAIADILNLIDSSSWLSLTFFIGALMLLRMINCLMWFKSKTYTGSFTSFLDLRSNPKIIRFSFMRCALNYIAFTGYEQTIILLIVTESFIIVRGNSCPIRIDFKRLFAVFSDLKESPVAAQNIYSIFYNRDSLIIAVNMKKIFLNDLFLIQIENENDPLLILNARERPAVYDRQPGNLGQNSRQYKRVIRNC